MTNEERMLYVLNVITSNNEHKEFSGEEFDRVVTKDYIELIEAGLMELYGDPTPAGWDLLTSNAHKLKYPLAEVISVNFRFRRKETA